MAKSFDPQGAALRNLTTAIAHIGDTYRDLIGYSHASSSAPSTIESIGELRRYITDGEAALLDGTITVSCIFYPALLLRRGWWEDQHIEIPPLRGPIQRWLTYGMFEWAPSWEFPPAGSDGAARVLPAQVGDGDCDESDSLTVLIIGQTAVERVQAAIKQQLDDFGRIAFWSRLTGRLVQTPRLAKDASLPPQKLARDPSSYALL